MLNNFHQPAFKKWHWLLIISGGLLLILAIGLGVGYRYYQAQLEPISSSDKAQLLTVKKGANTSQIAEQLAQQKLIKSATAFKFFSKLSGNDGKIQAGGYLLKPSMTVPEIVKDLVTGKTRQMTITFYPGATLNFRANDRDTTPSHKESLLAAGFSQAEIEAALTKKYDHKLFKLLPEASTLEGLIYGDTFSFGVETTIDGVMNYLWDYYYDIIKNNQLEQKYQAQGLTLYQGITLASIIEKEVSNKADREQAAQVFLSRIDLLMKLGSDVTYQYACRLLGVPNNLNIDSPYNTRRYPGLPPTPIATPGITSLLAVAKPAQGDFLFFLAGDDFKTYFAHTNAEHEKNIRDHCQVGCSVQ